jgi:hypothetical protein
MRIKTNRTSASAAARHSGSSSAGKSVKKFSKLLQTGLLTEKDNRDVKPPVCAFDSLSNFACRNPEPAPHVEKTLGAGCLRPEAAEGLDLQTQLAQRIARAACRPALAQANQAMTVTFHGGMLEGATCRISVTGGKVRCRLRARGAVARKEIAGGRARVGGALAARGLSLDSFEVSR